jgi:hypothetical protein
MPDKKIIGVDRFFKTALGAPMTKEAGVAKLIQTPLGRAALKFGLPAAIGGVSGYKLAPTPEEKFRAAFKGSILGGALGFGARKGIGRLFPKSNFALTAGKIAKSMPKGKAKKFSDAANKIIRRQAISKSEAENVIKHMTPTMAVAGKGLAAAGAAKYIGDWMLPSFLGIQPVRHVSPQYMGKVSSVRHVVEMPGHIKNSGAAEDLLAALWVSRPALKTVKTIKKAGSIKRVNSIKKTAATKEDRPSYMKQVALGAVPLTVKQMADIPKGTIESSIERGTGRKLGLSTKAAPALTKADLILGLKRFGGGAAAGVMTGPLFISGIKKMQSNDKKEQAKGMAQVVGSGAVYQASKGTLEALTAEKLHAARVTGKPIRATAKEILEALKTAGKARSLVSIPGAMAAAYGAARGSKGDGKETSKYRAAAYGALGGAAGGAFKGMAEVPLKSGMKTPQLLRKMVSKGAGRAAAGAVGGAALGGLFKWISKKMAGKKPQAPKQRKYLRRWKDTNGEWQYEYPKEKSAAAVTWGPKTGFTVVT